MRLQMEVNANGWRMGEEYCLAFSPERVDPGRTDYTTRTTPTVIGGVTPAYVAVAGAYDGRDSEHLAPMASPEVGCMMWDVRWRPK